MHDTDTLILKGSEVLALLRERELELIQTVRKAYETFAQEDVSLPYSQFLNFPNAPKNRIIALPAYLGGDFAAAGIKWVASFPDNLAIGLDRASAVLILNSTVTGRPQAIIEGSIINAKRTAASAALAAYCLQASHKATVAGFLGCGLINFEIARFLLAICPEINSLMICDSDSARAEQFKTKCRDTFAGVEVNVVKDAPTLLKSTELISMATTAAVPHIFDLSDCAPGSTILHISLRDLSPEVILSCDNIVDDIDHVCRAQTSVHLAEQYVGNRDFIRCTLAEILLGKSPPRGDSRGVAVFSPFGMGVLDIAVGKLVCELALEKGAGMIIESFLPEPWVAEKSFRAPSN
jgi:2,3-diaminopropionate biosynthesis protein SbnB